MNSKRGIAFSIAAIAAVIVLFSSGPLVTNQQAQAFVGGFYRGFGFHHFGFFHHPFFFHRILLRQLDIPRLKEVLQTIFSCLLYYY